MKRDEQNPLDPQDPLWELLGKARQPKERPFFASKVMRAVRAEEAEGKPVSIWAWLRAKWVIPALVSACAVVGGFVMMNPPAKPGASDIASGNLKDASSDPIDKVIDESIDQLLVAEDQSAWLSADPSSFLP